MRYYRDPQREIRQMHAQVEQAFRSAQERERVAQPVVRARPPLDFSATAEAFYVILDLPGVAREDVDVHVEPGSLVIRGSKRRDESEGGRLVRQERLYGQFTRTVPLPSEADIGDVSATLRRGELEVRIGRKPEAGPRRVEVTAE